MRIADSLVEQLLRASGKVSDEQIKDLLAKAAKDKKPLQDLAIKTSLVSERDLTAAYAKEIDVPLIELNAREIKKDVLQLLPERIARQYHAVVFGLDENGTKLVAMEDPDDIQAINFLQKQLGNDMRVYITLSSLLSAALDQYRGDVSRELTQVISEDDIAATEEEAVSQDDLAEDSPVAQTVNLLIEYGIKSGASDIHIEPRENFVVIRYRVDGVLREANKLPRKVLNALVSRIKILSNLKIDEHRSPQDGRFKIQVGGNVYALRVSTLPITDGEKVVMRILNESSKAADFTELGFWGDALVKLEHAIVQPHGMILVTGPTGSGKSTTLFSVLSKLNTPDVNISTVEDPVEYRIPGVNQTQVNPLAGMTFTNGLRALLRQDPNVIMVGEIRDGETADLAVQAALTGHLVFSTLHTNNAATCLPRLLDMNVEPFLIASTVRVVIAQRLVRRLCPVCREIYQPTVEEQQRLAKSFAFKADTVKRVHGFEQQALKDNIGVDSKDAKSPTNSLSTSENAIHTLYRPHDEGCENCNRTGFKGRIGIYEVLDNNEPIQQMVVSGSTSEALETKAIEDGMLTMQLDGLVKSLRGETAIEEVLRVTTSEA